MRQALLAIAAALALTGACASGPAVVARDDAGRVVAALPLGRDGTFELTYRHSVYDVPARERFVRAGGGGFALAGVASPSEAVLDYYAAAGPRRFRDGEWQQDLARPPAFAALPLVATSVGGRRLSAGGRDAPLAGSEPRHLTLRLEPALP